MEIDSGQLRASIFHDRFLSFILFPLQCGISHDTPQNGRPKERTIRWRQAHNLSLFVYSAICCVGSFWYLIHDDGQLYDWHRLMCTPVEGTILRPLSITFVLSKAWEWWDTAFLVWLGRSPPKFLHLYHHATTFWLFCLTINMPSSEKFGLLLNGGVHTLMYWLLETVVQAVCADDYGASDSTTCICDVRLHCQCGGMWSGFLVF